MGRPSTFTPEIGLQICQHLTEGNSLTSFCQGDGRPGYGTIFGWLETNAEFAQQYARAREVQAHNDADQQADVRRQVAEGTLQPDQARVIIDSLKWTAGRRAPKVYGDRLDVAVTGDVAFGARLAASRAAVKPDGD